MNRIQWQAHILPSRVVLKFGWAAGIGYEWIQMLMKHYWENRCVRMMWRKCYHKVVKKLMLQYFSVTSEINNWIKLKLCLTFLGWIILCFLILVHDRPFRFSSFGTDFISCICSCWKLPLLALRRRLSLSYIISSLSSVVAYLCSCLEWLSILIALLLSGIWIVKFSPPRKNESSQVVRAESDVIFF